MLPENFVVSGTPEQLAIMLPLLEAQYQFFKNLDLPEGGGGYEDRLVPEFKGKIKLKLKFLGKTETGKDKDIEKSIRLLKLDPATITLAKIQALARLTYSKFHNFEILLGKNSFNYVNWNQGAQIQQMQFLNEAQARKLVEQLLDIAEESPNWKFLRNDSSSTPLERFPEVSDKVIVAGHAIKLPQQRPLGKVKFSQAYIRFPYTTRYELLCSNSGKIIQSLDFLKAYND